MSKVYLEREAICENCKNKDSCFPYPEMRAKCPVYKTPAADVEPIQHGEWNIVYVDTGHIDMEKMYKCSVCGSRKYIDYYHCPNCRAKMDGGKG